MTSATKKNPSLWKRIVARIKAQASHGTAAGQWSGRKAQAAVKAYKKAGGGYSGAKKSSNSLSKWSKQKWRTKSGKKSSETGERYLPKKPLKVYHQKNMQELQLRKEKIKLVENNLVNNQKAIAQKLKGYRT